MRTIRRIILILRATLICGCTDSYNATSESYTEQCNRIIGESDKWRIVQVNDSVVVCIPKLNASSDLTPVVINLHKVD